ncbi:MAG: hypothetical protein ACXWQ5_21665 [Ktedonobacterales bacterium]
MPPAPTATPTLAVTSQPTNVPAGWKVLETDYFSLAYPPDWTTQTQMGNNGPRYFFAPPSQQSQVIVAATPQGDVSPYCLSAASGAQHMTLAGLPMTYLLTGAGNTLRTWLFANKQRTFYSLQAQDTQAPASLQAQDEALLATFRPDNADPWSC